MFKKLTSITLIVITLASLLVGCGKQEDTPITIIDELPKQFETLGDGKIENLPANGEKVEAERLPAHGDEEVKVEELEKEYTMEELRQMRIQRMNSHIPPIGPRCIGGRFRVPVRPPVVPVPIVRPNPELMEKIMDFLKDVITKPQPIGPIMPFRPGLLGNKIVA